MPLLQNVKMKQIIKAHRFRNLNQFKKSLNKSYLNDFAGFQQQLIFNSKIEREKLNIINETRSTKKTKTFIFALKNSFGDLVTDEKKNGELIE